VSGYCLSRLFFQDYSVFILDLACVMFPIISILLVDESCSNSDLFEFLSHVAIFKHRSLAKIVFKFHLDFFFKRIV
jgi:hypothetical protein